jgi:hypothetical protein
LSAAARRAGQAEQTLDRANRKANLYAGLFAKFEADFNVCLTLPTPPQQNVCLQQAWGDLQRAIAWVDAKATSPPP